MTKNHEKFPVGVSVITLFVLGTGQLIQSWHSTSQLCKHLKILVIKAISIELLDLNKLDSVLKLYAVPS